MASPTPPPPPPVGEDSWLDFIDQQRRSANSLEQRIRVVEIFRSAVNAEPGSIRIWITYCDYFWGLYVECMQRAGPVASWPLEEQQAAADIFSLDAALHLWSEGHDATKYRLSDSHELWNRWIALERELLDRTRTAEGVRRITHLYRNRLTIPHAAWDDTSSAFSSFLSEYNPSAYEDIMRAVTEQSRTAKAICDLRDPMEMALRAAVRADDLLAQREAMTAYLTWEVSHAEQASPEDQPTAVRVAFGLFARALSGILQDDDVTWTDLVVFVSQMHSEHAAADAPRRNDDVAQILPNRLDILQRAVQHCPWSGTLWARYIICGEQASLSFSDMERIKHAATNSPLDRDGMTAVVDMYAAWCSYLRRSAMDPGASDEAVDIADSGLVAAIEAVQVWGERRFGSAYQGDPSFRVERIMIQHLTDKHGAIEDARNQWEKLAANELHQRDFNFWRSYYFWEMLVFHAQKNVHRSPTPGPTSRGNRAPILATRVLRRALQVTDLNWPDHIMDIYIQHCNDFQSADVLRNALDDVHKLHKTLAQQRKEAAAAQQAAEAQAQARAQSQAEAEAQVGGAKTRLENHDFADQREEKQQESVLPDSPASAKRKREAYADDTSESAAKRAKNEATTTVPAPTYQQQQQQHALKRDRENTSVYVSNLPVDATATKIRQYFREYGHVNNIQLKQEKDGKSAVALVEFRSIEDVQSALIRDGKYYADYTISVKAATDVTLFLTNFPPATDDAYIQDLFKKCGPIFGIRWPSLKFNAHRRFCYVSFRNAESAAKALHFDGRMLDGQYKLQVKYSEPTVKKSRVGATEEGREVHVKNLGFDVEEPVIKDLFAKYGTVERVRLLRNITGRSRGSAFVVMETKEGADAAVAALDKAKLGSRILTVEISVSANFKPTARETSAAPGTPASDNASERRNSDAMEVETKPNDSTTAAADKETDVSVASIIKNSPQDRTFALLGIPDTVNIARVRAFVEPHGRIVKLMLQARHGGAVVEFADAAAAGKAQLALNGSKLGDHTLRTGTVAELFKEKGEVRIDRVDIPVRRPDSSAAALIPQRVKRPTLGKGAKRGIAFPGSVTSITNTKKNGEQVTMNGVSASGTGEQQPVQKSNADFRALLLGQGPKDNKPTEEKSDKKPAVKDEEKKNSVEEKTTKETDEKSGLTSTPADASDEGKMEVEVTLNGH